MVKDICHSPIQQVPIKSLTTHLHGNVNIIYKIHVFRTLQLYTLGKNIETKLYSSVTNIRKININTWNNIFHTQKCVVYFEKQLTSNIKTSRYSFTVSLALTLFLSTILIKEPPPHILLILSHSIYDYHKEESKFQ